MWRICFRSIERGKRDECGRYWSFSETAARPWAGDKISFSFQRSRSQAKVRYCSYGISYSSWRRMVEPRIDADLGVGADAGNELAELFALVGADGDDIDFADAEIAIFDCFAFGEPPADLALQGRAAVREQVVVLQVREIRPLPRRA